MRKDKICLPILLLGTFTFSKISLNLRPNLGSKNFNSFLRSLTLFLTVSQSISSTRDLKLQVSSNSPGSKLASFTPCLNPLDLIELNNLLLVEPGLISSNQAIISSSLFCSPDWISSSCSYFSLSRSHLYIPYMCCSPTEADPPSDS